MANYDTFYFYDNLEQNETEGVYILENIENNQGIAITEADSHFSYAGYYIDNWNTARDGSGIKYLPGDLIDNPETNIFYAIWKKPPKYLITAEQLEQVADTIRICAGTSTKLSYPWGFIERINIIAQKDFKNFLNGTMTNLSLEVSSIRDHAFYNCSNLTSINFPICTSIGDHAFYSCPNLTSINFPACISIGSYAFGNCSNLSSINFPICTLIENAAFRGCRSLTSIDFPSCTSIGSFAFYVCYNLTSVNFPACTIIGSSAFDSCSNLTSINFPVCTSIKSYAFRSCFKLLSAYFLNSSIPSLQYSNVFSSTPISGYTSYTNGIYGSIFVRASMLGAFKSATNWAYYANRFVGLTDEEIASLEN